MVVVENGTSGAAIGGMRMPGGVKVVNQPIWGSIGYTLPALLGTLMAALSAVTCCSSATAPSSSPRRKCLPCCAASKSRSSS
ncbi:hypothetical protein M5585_26555 [Serratia ureilytica]